MKEEHQGEGTYTYGCNKMNCHFCQSTQERTPKETGVIVKYMKTSRLKDAWDQDEIAILFDNINEPYSKIIPLLIGRSEFAIKTMKSTLAEYLGFKWVNGKWIEQ